MHSILIIALGAICGIAVTMEVSRLFLGADAALLLLSSMGAGAVLLFAAPHAPLSRPWPALGGHAISAVIGVAVAHYMGDSTWAAALAVGLSIFAMHGARCLHPPGGATALVAVLGGPGVHALGYSFVLAPVMLNALTLLLTARLFHRLLDGRWSSLHALPRTERIPQPRDLARAIDRLGMRDEIDEAEVLHILAEAERLAREKGKE